MPVVASNGSWFPFESRMGMSGLTGSPSEALISASEPPTAAAEHCRFIPRNPRFSWSITSLNSSLSTGRWLLWIVYATASALAAG